jgi:tRNA A-37 threonylcarbamoyl transferase component Bud32
MEFRKELKKNILVDTLKIKKKSNVCVVDILRHFTIFGQLKPGYFGDVYAMGVGKDPRYTANTYSAASRTRRIPKFIMKVMYYSKLNMGEVNMLKQILNLMWKQTPHVPLYYKHFTCEKTMFSGHNGKGIGKMWGNWNHLAKEGKSIILFMEYVGKSTAEFLKTNDDPNLEVIMIFQLLYTIHVMQQHSILHGDVHVPNMTCMKSGKHFKKLWEYHVDGTIYLIEVGSHIPVFIDFGTTTNGKTSAINPKSSDALALIRTWKNHTKHDSIHKFMKTIRSAMYIDANNTTLLNPRYTQTSNILKDFFSIFLKNSMNTTTLTNLAVQKVWNSSIPKTTSVTRSQTQLY